MLDLQAGLRDLLTRQFNSVLLLSISACRYRLKSKEVVGHSIAGSVGPSWYSFAPGLVRVLRLSFKFYARADRY